MQPKIYRYKDKKKATYPAKNGIRLHKMPAMLVIEIAGHFRNQNTQRGLEFYGAAFPEEYSH
jgi:hypothetical protein